MDFLLREDQRIFKDTFRRFAETEIAPLVEEAEETETFPLELFPLYAMIGASLVANLNAFNQLPKEYQQILQEEVTKMVQYTYAVSGPALEKIAQEEGKKQFGAETVFIPDEEFVKFREAVKPLWEEWEKKSDYCAQLVRIAREFAPK